MSTQQSINQVTWLEIAAAVSGELTSPLSHASYASATASAGTPMSANKGWAYSNKRGSEPAVHKGQHRWMGRQQRPTKQRPPASRGGATIFQQLSRNDCCSLSSSVIKTKYAASDTAPHSARRAGCRCAVGSRSTPAVNRPGHHSGPACQVPAVPLIPPKCAPLLSARSAKLQRGTAHAPLTFGAR